MASKQAIAKIRDEIAKLRSPHYSGEGDFAADQLQWALDTLTAADPVAALPGEWRDEAATLRLCRERERGTGSDMFHIYGAKAAQCDDCARQLDAAMKWEQ